MTPVQQVHILVVLALLFGLNVGGLRNRLLGKSAAAAPAIRLAVLPFDNLSGDPEQEYFSDGIDDFLGLGRTGGQIELVGADARQVRETAPRGVSRALDSRSLGDDR